MQIDRSILYDFLEGGGKPMECSNCGDLMYSPLLNITLGEKLWKCRGCGHREIEKVEVKGDGRKDTEGNAT